MRTPPGAMQLWAPPGILSSIAPFARSGPMGQIIATALRMREDPEALRILRTMLATPPSLTGNYGVKILTEPKSREPNWEALLSFLYETVKRGGFLQILEGRPKSGKEEQIYHWDIETTARGCELVDLLADFVPDGYDLLDLLARINWGIWELHKGVVGTLRSLGMFEERWGGKKIDALHHPFSRRAKEVEAYCAQLLDGEMHPQDLLRDPNLLASLTRLEVECYVLELFLGRPHWIARLFKTSERDLSHYFQQVSFFRAISEKHLQSTQWRTNTLRWILYSFS